MRERVELFRIFDFRAGKYIPYLGEKQHEPILNIYGECIIPNTKVEWWTGLTDSNGIWLYENDIIQPIEGHYRQYLRIWKVPGGFVLSESLKDLSRPDMLLAESLSEPQNRTFVEQSTILAGSAITRSELTEGRSREEMILELIEEKKRKDGQKD